MEIAQTQCKEADQSSSTSLVSADSRGQHWAVVDIGRESGGGHTCKQFTPRTDPRCMCALSSPSSVRAEGEREIEAERLERTREAGGTREGEGRGGRQESASIV